MTQRLHDWGQLWQIRQSDQPHERPSLQAAARQQAQQLEPLTLGQLAWTLKHLPDKACGPDAITAQLLRTAPPLALPPLLHLFQEMEKQAQLPTQQQMHMVIMLPKSSTKERPITLTSLLYRVWCRLRKPLLDQWQKQLPPTMDHDRARPGAQVLQVALERLLRQEVHRTNGRHGITCLMDMSTFYDTISLTRLQQEAQQLNYPPLLLEMAMQLYTGPKAIVAEQEMTPFFHVQNGVPAGCPQAPLLAKAALAPALQPWKASHPEAHLSSWVDDVGFDLSGSTPMTVAKKAVQAYRDLHERLVLKVNPQKTAFITTDKHTDKALRELLTPDDPPIQTVMRDLGVDHQGARRRRIPVMKQRLNKAHTRKLKLRTLRLPALKIRLRLHRGGIQPAALWGVEGQGLAPRYRTALRQAMAQHLGHHKGGLLDSTHDLHHRKYIDPGDQVVLHHLKAIHSLIQAWPDDQMAALEQAWAATHSRVQNNTHPWYTVRGPMAAAITYLREWGWQASTLMRWTRPETPLLTGNELDLQQPWWKLEKAIIQEAQQQRINRLASRPHYHNLITGIDWHTYHAVKKQLPAQSKHYLNTWVQAAVQYREATKTKQCPLCHVEATPKHILWLCKWHKTQKHDPMPAEWMERITSKDEEPLWTAGWTPLEPQEHRTHGHPHQGHGCWADLTPLAPQPHNGWAYTLDATPSSYDERNQMWVYGLCIHTMSLGQLSRLGAITGVAPGAQTKARALLAGVVALAKHTTTTAKVIVQLVTVWEAWHQPKSRAPFRDILEEVTEQDYSRITVLYVSKATRTPDAPGNEPQLRRRQRDAALTAWERAKQFQDHKQEEWQQVLDNDHQLVYKHAVQRLAKIYEDPQHYIHHKAPRHQGKHTKQYKRDLVKQCTKAWDDTHHRWEPHRSGYQCVACGTRMHQGLTKTILEERLQESCPQVLLEEAQASPAQADPPAKKLTRAQTIKNLLHQQQQQPPDPSDHHFAETTGYLKCLKCGVNTHKRVNEEAFQSFISSRCIDEQYTQSSQAHSSHSLWQKGGKVRCTSCGCQWNLDADCRIISNLHLTKACRGTSGKGSPPISEFFKRKSEALGQEADSAAQALEAPDQDRPQGPTPRRLHFPTALDERNSTAKPGPPAHASGTSADRHPDQAMIPSQATGTLVSTATGAQSETNRPPGSQERDEEESLTTDDEMQADFF